MGFRGTSVGISFSNVGVQHNPNTDALPPDVMVHPTTNVNFEDGGISSRGSTRLVNASPAYGGGRIWGGIDYRKTDGTVQYQMVYADDGKIYKSTTDTVATGLNVAARPSFVQAGDSIYFCNGVDAPLQGDPSAGNLAAFTHPATDWTADPPFQLLLHVNGANRRLVGLSKTKVIFSKNGTLDEFVTGVVSYTVDVRGGLVGGFMFGSRLMVFGQDEALIFNTDDVDTTNWGYSKAPWVGGVAHFRLILPTENDVLCMTDDGAIYSIARVQAFNDYRKADLTKPAFIDRWIREHVKLASIADFHAIWDPRLRVAKFFVVRAGRTQVESSVNFYPDRAEDRAWTIHENLSSTSGYNASCSFRVHASAGSNLVYTGDYAGSLWKLEQPDRNDNGAAFPAKFRLPHLNLGDLRRAKRFVRGFLILEPQGNYSLTVKIWVDGVAKPATTVSMAGSGAVLGAFILGIDVLGGRTLARAAFNIGYRGERLQLEFSNSNVDQPFFVSQLLVDMVPLGARPS